MTANDLRARRPPVYLHDTTVTYPGQQTPTLAGVNLHVAAGEFLCVVGPSGAGKTTLLRLLTGQLRPTSGTAVAVGLDLMTLPARKLPTLRRRIGVTFQDARLLPGRTVHDNLTYALELAGTRRRVAISQAKNALDLVGITHLADRTPDHLSGGEAQRVGIARAICGQPPMLLADEPTGNLDPQTAATIVTTLADLADAGTSVLMVTHDHAAVHRLGRRVVQISDGTLSTPNELPDHEKDHP